MCVQTDCGGASCAGGLAEADLPASPLWKEYSNANGARVSGGMMSWASDAAGSQVEMEEVEALPTFNLPLLVRAVGATLACSAGLINSVAFYELGYFVSHHTGTYSKVGFGNMEALYLLLSFVGGSATCGLFIGKDTVHIGLALYDFGLLSISGLLVGATLCHHNQYAKYFAAAACGLQNGMATFWGGAVVRTTHVTGLFTDVGLLIGRLSSIMIRKRFGKRFDLIDRVEVIDNVRKLSFLGTLAASFLIGIIIGMHVHNQVHEYAFLLPAFVVGALGLAYLFHRVFVLKHKFFSVAEMEIVDIPVDSIMEATLQDGEEKELEGGTSEERPRVHSTEAAKYFASGRFGSGSNFNLSREFGPPTTEDERLAVPTRIVAADGVAYQRERAGSISSGAPVIQRMDSPQGELRSPGLRPIHTPAGEFLAVSRRCALQRQESRQMHRQGSGHLPMPTTRFGMESQTSRDLHGLPRPTAPQGHRHASQGSREFYSPAKGFASQLSAVREQSHRQMEN